MRSHALGRASKARAICLLAALAGLSSQAHAYTHPRIPTTREELDVTKANLDHAYTEYGYITRPGEALSACEGGRQALNLNRKGRIL